MRQTLAFLLALILAACAQSFGDRANGFVTPELASAYIPLESVTYLVLQDRAAAVVIEPGVAVTNAHNAKIIGAAPVIGESRNYDLLFFHVESDHTVATATPAEGESVIAYGQGGSGELREARGSIKQLDTPVAARCESCSSQKAFIFESNAGPGFSGGPVVDAVTGKLVGITFGYLDPGGRRVMYAYPIGRVRNELATIEHKLPTDED